MKRILLKIDASSSDAFSEQHFVDKVTGKTYRKYTYKRKPCKTVVMTSKRAEQLAGYTLIEKDLRSCLAWLDEIDGRHGPTDKQDFFIHNTDRPTYTIIKGLFVALLTFYAKCFTQCEGRRIKLDRKKLDPQFHEIHDSCMNMRHNFAAHSGAEKIEQARIVAAYSPPKKGKLSIKLYRELDQPDMFGTSDGEVSIRTLLNHVHGMVKSKIEDLTKAVQNEEAPEVIMAAINAGQG